MTDEFLIRFLREGGTMKAGVYFTGTGPILLLTSHKSLVDEQLASKLASKGIEKFIACEVPVEMAKEVYGKKFGAVMNDLKQSDDLRVLDINGHNVFQNFPLRALGRPLFYEP